MKQAFLSIFGMSVISAMLVLPTGQANADIPIDFTTDGATGLALDGAALTSLPLTVPVDEVPGLTLTVQSASSFDPTNSSVNGSSTSFGINSPTPAVGFENASRFDVDASENMTIAFNLDVLIRSIEFINFSDEETFTFGGVTIGNAEYSGGDLPLADSSNLFTFSGSGLAVSSGTGLFMEAGGLNGVNGASVGVTGITLANAVPEPSSIALLGLGSVLMVVRRRRG